MIINKETFLNTYQAEGALTLNCLKELTDESLAQAVSEADRTLGEIAWHITISLAGIGKIAGIEVDDLDFSTPQPETAAEIVRAYEKVLKESTEKYNAFLTDENLMDEVDFFGHKMPRLSTLTMIIMHQVHHRGQMTVLMRQADLKVPNLYGTSRDFE